MSLLGQSSAKSVFRFFENICGIPHGSGNVDAISDYLVDFAKERNLSYKQDTWKNVIITKEGSEGYEKEPALILQGHMDMVAVKKPGCPKDMTKEGLDLAIDGDFLYAKDTSLGGDDGIAVAMMLAALDDESLAHPPLECVFTIDEETGLTGAKNIDLSDLKGKQLINLDSEAEEIFWTSCAGGARVHSKLPLELEEAEGVYYRINVEGLLGGHSGAEIHKERGNSNALAGRMIYECQKEAPIRLISLNGGLADNAIPRETLAEVIVSKENEDTFELALAAFEAKVKRELQAKDPGFKVVIQEKKEGNKKAFTEEATAKAAFLLLVLPLGVQAMSADIPGLVQTSLNLGVMKTEGNVLGLDYSVRSSVGSEKELLIDKIKELLGSVGGSCEVSGEYPAWEYRMNSPLRDKMIAVYKKLYAKEPKIEAIHAGLECGIFSGKIEDLDCISIGPDMMDIHTTEEKLSISSAERVWDYLCAVLAEK